MQRMNEDAWVHLIGYLNGKVKDEFEQKRQEYIAAGESEERAHRLAKKVESIIQRKNEIFCKELLGVYFGAEKQ